MINRLLVSLGRGVSISAIGICHVRSVDLMRPNNKEIESVYSWPKHEYVVNIPGVCQYRAMEDATRQLTDPESNIGDGLMWIRYPSLRDMRATLAVKMMKRFEGYCAED